MIGQLLARVLERRHARTTTAYLAAQEPVELAPELTRVAAGRSWPVDPDTDELAELVRLDLAQLAASYAARIDERVDELLEDHRGMTAWNGLCSDCAGTVASCRAARVKCCPDCSHTADQLRGAR